MNFLPKDIEDIILDYKYQMEHKENFSKCMEGIDSIKYQYKSLLNIESKSYSNRDNVIYYISGGNNLSVMSSGDKSCLIFEYTDRTIKCLYINEMGCDSDSDSE